MGLLTAKGGCCSRGLLLKGAAATGHGPTLRTLRFLLVHLFPSFSVPEKGSLRGKDFANRRTE